MIEEPTKLQRLSVVTISPAMFIELLKVHQYLDPETNRVIKIEGLPKDAEGVRFGLDRHGNVSVIFCSDTLEPLGLGERIPETSFTITETQV